MKTSLRCRRRFCGVGILLLWALPAMAAENEKPAEPTSAKATRSNPNPAPTFPNVAYGTHERQVLDFWQARADKPTPWVFYMHGGGWVRGDKNEVRVEKYLAAGISVVSINYRFSWQAQLAGVKPPVEWPMHDAGRALQFVRTQAKEWNIDSSRVGVSGQSAGGCTTLWLAMHDDMAQSNSSDPVARESTRVQFAAVLIAQTSLDPAQMEAWSPHSVYGGHAFGFMDPNDLNTRDRRFAEFLAHRDEVLPWIKEYSPIEHASRDDPPIYLLYTSTPTVGAPTKSPTHTANFGVKLQEKLLPLKVQCELVYPGLPNVMHATCEDFLIDKLRQ